jgi:hypothetical protein
MLWFPPIDLTDASILLLTGEILILITFKLSSPVDGLSFGINKKKLENAAIVAGILFLVTIAIRILGILGIGL